MVVRLNINRFRQCKDSQGGLDKIYLFKHINYSRSQIILNNNILLNDTFRQQISVFLTAFVYFVLLLFAL
jgi:hypothetical protein